MQTVASEAKGVEELATRFDEHFDWLDETGQLEPRRKARRRHRAYAALIRRAQRAAERVWADSAGESVDPAETPYATARRLYERLGD